MGSFSKLLTKEGPVFGTWSQIANEDVIEILSAGGFDFTIIDREHTAFDFATVERLIRACDAAKMTPLVRVSKNDRIEISRALDIGAAAVVVPGIASVDDAKAAVEASRFAPAGTRGACPFIRAGGHFVRKWDVFARGMEADTGAILLIENQEGFSNLESIVQLPGLRGLLAGPFDLSVSMGLQGNYLHPDVQAAVEHMIHLSVQAGVPVIVPVFAPDAAEARRQLDHWMEKGVRLFTVGGDKVLFLDCCTRYLKALTAGGNIPA